MTQYNIFQALPMSFYSKQLYRDVAQNWGGKAFLYLLFLVALVWIAHTIIYQIALNKGFNIYGHQFFSQVPMLTIQNGKLSTPENRPYMIKNPGDPSKNLILIDTTGKTTSLSQTDAQILVTQTEVISQPKPNEIREDVFPATLNMVIDPTKIESYGTYYLGYAWIFIFIFSVFFSYIFRVIQTLIYAILGKIFAAIGGIPVKYFQVVSIAMVAITPCIIVRTILDIFNVALPVENLLFFILAMIYLIYGISVNKNTQINENNV